MKSFILSCLFLFLLSALNGQTSRLKSVIYDFDGLDIGETNLPDGDYSNNDCTYMVAANPLSQNDVIGDRVLKLNLHWQNGHGEFGKGTARFYELNTGADFLNFYFYNPLANGDAAIVDITVLEDDDKDNLFNSWADDNWLKQIAIPTSPEWQLISLSLNSFTDNNTGGNGIFDGAFTNEAGMVFSINFIFRHPVDNSTVSYFIDMISFSEGTLPTGTTILHPPLKEDNDFCLLGALTGDASAASAAATPSVINSIFPGERKMSYVNWFVDYATTGTTPQNLPGAEVQSLLDNGFRPVITWEMLYSSYARLDPVQPRLDKINNGYFDSYIDDFADKIKQYNDTVIIRIFHEFEGDWYSWSLTQNNHDPYVYIAAFRHVVDRFRARGANKVLWMWCVNADPKPYLAYNWIVGAYPGDNYVNIVATDVYNHPDLGVPQWRSFRYTYAESYYYLTKYFPHKPLYICEVASRERYNGENLTSQSKADWICQMDKELQTYFNKTKALIFFSAVKEHDWRLNSSLSTQVASKNCIWQDNYYFKDPVSINPEHDPSSFIAYPNPFSENITIVLPEHRQIQTNNKVNFYDLLGKKVSSYSVDAKTNIGKDLPSGVYLVELENSPDSGKMKIVKIIGDK